MNIFQNTIHKCIYAWRGLAYVTRREVSFRIELLVAVLALGAAWQFHFTALAWALLLLTIVVVLAAEIINTMLERLLDLIEPRLSLHISLFKDMLAGALFILAVVAGIIGWLLLHSQGAF